MNKRNITAIGSVLIATSSLMAAAPSYPGGEEAINNFITSNLNYPSRALDNGIEGVVVVAISLDSEGKITEAKVCNSIDPDLEQEALRIVRSMSGWIPPVENGSPVPSTTSVRVIFNLP